MTLTLSSSIQSLESIFYFIFRNIRIEEFQAGKNREKEIGEGDLRCFNIAVANRGCREKAKFLNPDSEEKKLIFILSGIL